MVPISRNIIISYKLASTSNFFIPQYPVETTKHQIVVNVVINTGVMETADGCMVSVRSTLEQVEY